MYAKKLTVKYGGCKILSQMGQLTTMAVHNQSENILLTETHNEQGRARSRCHSDMKTAGAAINSNALLAFIKSCGDHS